MEKTNIRIDTIDIMRGLTLFLMLFVNDLYVPGVPKWMVHTAALEDGMGLADWVFPGFLFMVGIAIPFAFNSRANVGESRNQVLFHIFIRTFSLLTIGVFMVNLETYNGELTGLNMYSWALIVYLCVFLLWNKYPTEKVNSKLINGLKYLGVIGLIFSAAIFRSGTEESIGWMGTSWWGILGLIGWGYLTAAVVYYILRDRIGAIALVWGVFVLLNVIAQTTYLDFLNPIKPIFGVLIDGNIPSIVLAGLVVGLLVKKYHSNIHKLISYLIVMAILCLIMGFAMRNWIIISKIIGTPTWAMICNGISILVFAFLYYVVEVKNWKSWAKPFIPAGKNSLTTYLVPDMVYYLIWGLQLPILFYKQVDITWLAVFGSVLWSFIMILFAAFLSKLNVRLKL